MTHPPIVPGQPHPDEQPQYGQPSNWTAGPAYPIQAGPYPPGTAGEVMPYSAPPQSTAGWQQQPQQAGYPSAYGPLVRPTSGMATISMIFGIVGVLAFCLVIPSLVAVLTGHIALKETRGGIKAGHGQTITGLVLGYLVLIPAIAWGVIAVFGMIVSAAERSA